MESKSLFHKIPLSLSHLPTGLLIIGYPVYWIELFFFKNNYGQTSLLAPVLFFLLFLNCCPKGLRGIRARLAELRKAWTKEAFHSRILIGLGAGICFFILLCSLYATCLPPHLIQESDVLNYHYTLPRQHLILNSFEHIPWSSVDLFLLPLQFALSPYWFAASLPNKLPQFIFLIGILMIVSNLIKRLGADRLSFITLGIFAVVGSHNVGIQMGTAMLDLVICYLFLAFVDSFLKGNIFLAAIEFSFFLWSKPFIPFQMGLIVVGMFLLFVVLKIFHFKALIAGFNQSISPIKFGKWKEFLAGIIIFSIIISGPFMVKSLYYSGATLYPFGAGLIKMKEKGDADRGSWQSLQRAAKAYLSYVDSYGYGRSLGDFIRHFWLIAVPDEGVNNKFDYPVGLPYLLFIGPFICLLFRSLRQKIFPIIPLFIVAYWLLWWLGMQQTRFLYIPIVLMYITVLAEVKNSSYFLKGALVLALLLNALSVFRAHYHDFGKEPLKVLGERDLSLVRQSKLYTANHKTEYIDLPFGEVAFAQFPVHVTQEKLPFIIAASKSNNRTGE